jgi:hypothetical protein
MTCLVGAGAEIEGLGMPLLEAGKPEAEDAS